MVEEGIFQAAVTTQPDDAIREEERGPVQQKDSPPIPDDESQHSAWGQEWLEAHFPDKFLEGHSTEELTQDDLRAAATEDELVVLTKVGIITNGD